MVRVADWACISKICYCWFVFRWGQIYALLRVILWQSKLGQISTFDFIEFQQKQISSFDFQSLIGGGSNKYWIGTYNFSFFAEEGMALHCVVRIGCYKVENVIICRIRWAVGNPKKHQNIYRFYKWIVNPAWMPSLTF